MEIEDLIGNLNEMFHHLNHSNQFNIDWCYLYKVFKYTQKSYCILNKVLVL